MKRIKTIFLIFSILFISLPSHSQEKTKNMKQPKQKKVVYQVFTRLFGNTKTLNKPWGTKEENGVGKFSDFTDKALQEIKKMGVTHIWYTGVPHHALVGDYTKYGISNDDPDVVKGRAGSPYAVKDYYNVDPDLAENPENRLEEFKALIERTHKNGMKVIIDIVPNHVARKYHSISKPREIRDFGEDDNTSVIYDVNNNFYYNPNEDFVVPKPKLGFEPLGGEPHPLSDGKFNENPSKWTGNGARSSKPDFNDWYETVKINFGIRPNGQKDFENLPQGFENESYKIHYQFWKDKTVPNTWKKFKDIALFWLDFGVDGFRYDMAELVPVEFWSYMNSSIKMKNPNAFLMAEVYNPNEYRNYIQKGKMDYLYDKVQLYDTLRNIIQHKHSTDAISHIQHDLSDIEEHMLHFLENHDEQRIASAEFAGNPKKAMPAMVISALISNAPTMIYFGQEVGEPGGEKAGFGSPSRTSIFDYIGVPYHQRWMNEGKFDGGKLNFEERNLRDFYVRLLNIPIVGKFFEIHNYNRQHTEFYNDKVYSFARGNEKEQWIVVTNFSEDETFGFELKIPNDTTKEWQLHNGNYIAIDQLYGEKKIMRVENGHLKVRIDILPLQSFVYLIKQQ